jgi:DNA-binding SARP family transcriptional activator
MEASRSTISTDAFELSTSVLLKQTRAYLTQARLPEGVALLSLIHENLHPEQSLAKLTRSLIEGCHRHIMLQQQLLEVSTDIAKINDQLRESITSLQNLQTHFLKEASLLIETSYEEERSSPIIYQVTEPQQDPVSPETSSSLLYAVCLAPFELRQGNTPQELCTNRNGQAILRYLIAQENHSATVDTLMTLLWPDDPTDVALNKLYVAVSLLRRSLQKGEKNRNKYILYKQGVYQLDPSVQWRTDVEEFLELHHLGRKEQGLKAIEYYERACSLYKRPFMLEDLYANWSFQRREYLRQVHITMCHALVLHYIKNQLYEQATHWANEILEENHCDEEAHQHLIRIYALRGRRHDALRQYQLCQKVLQEEMSVDPMPDTVNLFQSIMRGDIL